MARGPKEYRMLYLDDRRSCPKGWVPVRTVEDFRYMTAQFPWDIISMDYDLSETDPYRNDPHVTSEDGLTLLQEMFRLGHLPKEKPRVHSSHPIGRVMMQQFIDENWEQAKKKR